MIYQNRRRFIADAAMTVAATHLGMVGLTKAQSTKTTTSFGPLKQIDAGVLNVGYAEVGPVDSRPVILLQRLAMTFTVTSKSLHCWRRGVTA